MAALRSLSNPNPAQIAALLKSLAAEGIREVATSAFASAKLDQPKLFYGRGNISGNRTISRQRVKPTQSIAAIPDDGIYPLPSWIGAVTAGNNIAHEVALAFNSRWKRVAPVRTGNYARNLYFALNGKVRDVGTIAAIGKSNPLSDKEIVMIFNPIIYASKLEVDYKKHGGIFAKITKELIGQFGSRASIAFTYISGAQLMAGTVLACPVVLIGAPGAFASGLSGGTGKQRNRRARRKAKLRRMH